VLLSSHYVDTRHVVAWLDEKPERFRIPSLAPILLIQPQHVGHPPSRVVSLV
jgi:hypothetical protein